MKDARNDLPPDVNCVTCQLPMLWVYTTCESCGNPVHKQDDCGQQGPVYRNDSGWNVEFWCTVCIEKSLEHYYV